MKRPRTTVCAMIGLAAAICLAKARFAGRGKRCSIIVPQWYVEQDLSAATRRSRLKRSTVTHEGVLQSNEEGIG